MRPTVSVPKSKRDIALCPRKGSPRPAAEALEGRLLFAAGALDPSFGVARPFSYLAYSTPPAARAVAVQADGKTVVAGAFPGGKLGIARLNVNGTLDFTFGPDRTGRVVTAFGESFSPAAVALQADGKIVVAGASVRNHGELPKFGVARFNADGTIDTSFDGDGFKAVGGDFGDYYVDFGATAKALAIQSDGKIVVAGTARTRGGDVTNDDFAFTRLNPNGSVDSSFGDDGLVDVGFGEDDELSDAGITTGGKIVAVGTKQNATGSQISVALTRLNSDGSVDGSFGSGGRTVQSSPGEAVAMRAAALVTQSDGKIVVAGTWGWVGSDFMLLRFGPDGKPDTSFGDRNGIVTARGGNVSDGASNIGSDVLSTPDGTLLFAGDTTGVPGSTRTYVLAFTADGAPDWRYGDHGQVQAPGDFGDARLAYGPGKRFVLAGGQYFQTARFLDVGANLVRLVSLNPSATEGGDAASLFVYRSEILPYATKVYLDVGGTAAAPRDPIRGGDYAADTIVFPFQAPGNEAYPYVIIPAHTTVAIVNITAVDDTRAEGDEQAVFRVRPDAAYDIGDPSSTTITVHDNDATLTGSVAGRYAFYNHSRFDGNDPAATPADDAAVAADKRALLPGQTASFANYTSYTRGLNGVMVDVAGLPAGATPTPDDFAFRVGTDSDPSKWQDGPSPTSLLLRRGAGAGGSDRLTLTWPDGAIRNEWLQVTVLSTLRTGLPRPDVFYFGNLVGETGNGPNAAVNALDAGQVRANLRATALPPTNRFDFDRNGMVTALDLAAARANQLASLTLLSAPGATVAPSALPSPFKPRDGGSVVNSLLSP